MACSRGLGGLGIVQLLLRASSPDGRCKPDQVNIVSVFLVEGCVVNFSHRTQFSFYYLGNGEAGNVTSLVTSTDRLGFYDVP